MHPILGTMTFGGQVNAETAAQMITGFTVAGHRELDTAYVYNKGATEELLGKLQLGAAVNGDNIATKVNPSAGGLSADSVNRQFTTSLARLGTDSIDLLYLHQPDLNVAIEETLEAVFRHFEAGRLKRFGLSNYASWQVAEIAELCKQNGWMRPSVYQGMYNALTRDVERELLPCLKNYNIAFYAYNPLAGGMLTGKHQAFEAPPSEGRFGSFDNYPERYWKADYISVVRAFSRACSGENIKPADAALRWLNHHSDIADRNCQTPAFTADNGIILGASSSEQFDNNLNSCAAGPLPNSIVAALDDGWEKVRPNCIKYFRP